MKTNKQQKNKEPARKNMQNISAGFTLIELMVATSIFVVVMLASMSSLFVLLDASKSSRVLRFAMDNVNFSMESMARSIRMGKNYYCVPNGAIMPSDIEATRDCASGGTFISFVPQGSSTSRVGYRLHTDNNTQISTLQRCDGNNNCVAVISPDVNVETLKFFVRGSAFDNIQASVYIIMKGTVVVKGVPTSFSIQTMASQRNF